MEDMEKVALTALPRDLNALTGSQSPSYRRLYFMVLDGRVPAQQVNGRYFVRRSDLPGIAAMLGMTRSTASTKTSVAA